jgi:hypothetical protein
VVVVAIVALAFSPSAHAVGDSTISLTIVNSQGASTQYTYHKKYDTGATTETLNNNDSTTIFQTVQGNYNKFYIHFSPRCDIGNFPAGAVVTLNKNGRCTYTDGPIQPVPPVLPMPVIGDLAASVTVIAGHAYSASVLISNPSAVSYPPQYTVTPDVQMNINHTGTPISSNSTLLELQGMAPNSAGTYVFTITAHNTPVEATTVTRSIAVHVSCC